MSLIYSQKGSLDTFINEHEDLIKALSAFRKLAENLQGKMTVDAICYEVTKIMAEELHLENCSIMLLDEERKQLQLQCGAGSRFDEKVHNKCSAIPVGKGIAGIVAQTGTPLYIEDANQDPRFLKLEASVKVGALLSIPIITGDDILGVINMSHPEKGAFCIKQFEVFSTLSMTVGHLIIFATMGRELERKVSERTRELKDSNDYLEEIIANANDMILTIERNGKITFTNQKVIDIGYTPRELHRRSYARFTNEAIPGNILRVLIRQGRAMWSTVVRDGTGGERDISSNISAVKGKGGRIAYFLVVARDITENNKIVKSIHTMEKYASLGEIAAGVAHELNNRLVPILSYAELLKGNREIGKSEKMLESIYTAATGCQQIIHAMLDFARPKNPEKSPVNINDVLLQALNLLNYKMESSGIGVANELSQTLPLTMADSHQLEQVFINIIHNAIQSMEGGGALTVSSRCTGERILLTVADTGCGIPETCIDRIFDPFFSTKEAGKGTGLGLSVSYSIIKSHDGDMSVRSREGVGSTFTIELPVAPGEGAVKKSESVQHSNIEVYKGRRRVLVVDDEEFILDVLREILEEEGYEVDCTMKAKEALDMVAGTQYDLVLTDVRMPALDGRDFYRIVTERLPHLSERVIFITGDIIDDGIGELKKFILHAGCSYLQKPFRVGELLEVVRTTLGK
ncbi:MAG: response regulator [Deltaproteobacteria bacterium]|nr:response regulator [Deltaproteobacteria bacterium]